MNFREPRKKSVVMPQAWFTASGVPCTIGRPRNLEDVP